MHLHIAGDNGPWGDKGGFMDLRVFIADGENKRFHGLCGFSFVSPQPCHAGAQGAMERNSAHCQATVEILRKGKGKVTFMPHT